MAAPTPNAGDDLIYALAGESQFATDLGLPVSSEKKTYDVRAATYSECDSYYACREILA